MVYFVATPIGNLAEITSRAVETLSSVDAVFCEDTRHSQILLNHLGIKKPLYAYHKFNEKSSLDFVLSFVRDGKDVAVISDAGMPGINDPGNVLVNALIDNGLDYTVVSGPSAFVNAFVMSGFLPPFTYVGFLPEKRKDKDELLDSVATNGVLIFYVSVHDLAKTFAYLFEKLGDRKACLVKELTKMHEKARFLRLSDTVDDDKGEFALVVDRAEEVNPLCKLSVRDHVAHYVEMGMSKNDAVKQTAKDRGVAKNDVYKLTLGD